MNRKTFLQKSLGSLILLSATPTVISCSKTGEDSLDTNSNSQKNCLDNGTSSSISSNHGHSVLVSKSDVLAGVDKTYNITGTANHAHSITVTAAHFETLKKNQSVTVSSTNDGNHTHSVLIQCA